MIVALGELSKSGNVGTKMSSHDHDGAMHALGIQQNVL
jgi:hypothetical protein